MIANNIPGSPEDAGECTNDTWLAVWNSIPPNRPDPLMNYVCRIAKNIALKRFRDDHRRKRSGSTALVFFVLGTEQSTEEETVSTEEECTSALSEEELDAAIAAMVEQIYPELTDEQEKAFNEQYQYYEDCYKNNTKREAEHFGVDFITVALYYDMIGKPKETLCVILSLTVEEAEKLVDIEWTAVGKEDAPGFVKAIVTALFRLKRC